MGSKTALIFGSACYDGWEFLKEFRSGTTVICADGGVLRAREAGFSPAAYVGDGDSGGAPPEGTEAICLPPEKDLTDLQAAYIYARDHGFREVVLTACTGGRQDHHLANLQLLETAFEEGISMRVLDPWNEVRYTLGGDLVVDCAGFRYISIVPLDRTLRDVRITNAKYPLDAAEVRRGDSLTVSNEPVDGPVRIRIGQGAAWIILSERI